MNWEDEGYLLSKRKFRENANIISVFTSQRGKVAGIVYGGNSRKIRNFLQISNTHREAKHSFVIVSSKIDIDQSPDALIIVPTLQEAHDIIEMEEMERDLGF